MKAKDTGKCNTLDVPIGRRWADTIRSRDKNTHTFSYTEGGIRHWEL